MKGKNWFEWLVFGLGVVLLLGLTAFLVREHLHRPDQPPVVRVEVGRPQDVEGVAAVPITLENTGGETAVAVQVQVMLRESGGRERQGELTVDFLPPGATREGWLNFAGHAGAGAEAEALVAGFQVP